MVKNTWSVPPDQVIAVGDKLLHSLTAKEWRLLALQFSPHVRRLHWLRRARQEFTMTQPQVKEMQQQLHGRILRHLVEAYVLACEERDGKPPSGLSDHPYIKSVADGWKRLGIRPEEAKLDSPSQSD